MTGTLAKTGTTIQKKKKSSDDGTDILWIAQLNKHCKAGVLKRFGCRDPWLGRNIQHKYHLNISTYCTPLNTMGNCLIFEHFNGNTVFTTSLIWSKFCWIQFCIYPSSLADKQDFTRTTWLRTARSLFSKSTRSVANFMTWLLYSGTCVPALFVFRVADLRDFPWAPQLQKN